MKIDKCLLMLLLLGVGTSMMSCSNEEEFNPVFRPVPNENTDPSEEEEEPGADLSAVERTFGDRIDLNNLANYANQGIPAYIEEDNGRNNPITDAGATLGRVLFYDVNLSTNNTISCSSCHKQAFAFSDDAQASTGVEGLTGRHSMRLVNARFAAEDQFFWDERANSLEMQSTQPIQDHVEMGFSGQEGNPDFDDLIVKLGDIDYYQELFSFVYGDPAITEMRIQIALAQFVRSIQSFDSRYDQGRAQANDNMGPFANFSQQENQGKALFMGRPQLNNQGVRTGGGAGCDACHRAPEFDIAPNSRNNGFTESLAQGETETDITRSPSLRDLVNPNGEINGPFMHTGSMNTLGSVIDHYDAIEDVPNLDNRLTSMGPGGPGGQGGEPQQLNLSDQEKEALEAFLLTLTGNNVYTDERWSDPFD